MIKLSGAFMVLSTVPGAARVSLELKQYQQQRFRERIAGY